ncbi:hypothetical protein CASFOL_006423 [Castilleja foliolosa]|uniref:Uncharacterized protein n=1 Tax=Castilleja foliolosa TaxID=1961234 RepID=A0ABD3EA88_9LAMI
MLASGYMICPAEVDQPYILFCASILRHNLFRRWCDFFMTHLVKMTVVY